MTGTLPSRLTSPWVALLRWNKPSGRLILLIPAGWSLWLNPAGPPSLQLILQILIGGLSVSAAGCVANDLWDQRIDREVARTSQRPLARGDLNRVQAFTLLAVLLTLSLLVVISLPGDVRWLCLQLAVLALPPILFYPSAKRWFPFPQAILALCWGFAVLIPWAAATGSLSISLPLLATWGATLCWTFSFDTVYAMADRVDDAKLKLRSSALTLGDSAVRVVRAGYGLTAAGLAMAAAATQAGVIFWIVWAVACIGFWRSTLPLKAEKQQAPSVYANHFARQVQLGSLLLAGVILSRLG
ncbi:4-hydroxybenzoate polyprenyltransferase [Synechococcus sp. BMK-MC-1]|uniref:4-hydroxybenzoate polyprenyltransferase n=1 Tax=Synechococcus sp. BMK-MC-1 TaxID=1442551 RepID=UPI001648103F|nr:4-hydroxybenzoate polyprenyltransferase [Synechococcus sp. BMK-MC-1]QNI68256.1 4-hydroxybenzoate polyprenyltransferase [Synechococcus sp. BMK-MC-1]